MILFATLFEHGTEFDRRDAERKPCRAVLASIRSAAGLPVLVLDISEAGLRIKSEFPFALGDLIAVQFPGLPENSATVRWCDGDEFGCEFVTPVSKAAVSAFILQASAVRDPLPEEPDLIEVEVGDRFGETSVASFVERLKSDSPGAGKQIVGFRVTDDGKIIAILRTPI